ncbi:right-handed parallel beta-helix repeat-containing protein [Jiangella rhizosphaerae]|uniref:Plasmid stabilization protein n=1 Tax=Jiangella rhizosphaerae TaxID=2293569 RepID=A0A418KMS2_9ACTN|nr:right-handed parallel beta-helix repeat-containing protein [Jiangella rhizosphaerae]RIQ20289.1 plasmid stabilization protein [Jiangella rhizosphaerae]
MRPRLRYSVLLVLAVVVAGCSGDSSDGDSGGSSDASPSGGGAELVRVPADAATITEAVAAVAEGGMVLVDAGTYPEAVVVDKADVTIRGADRNAVVVDGEGERAIGILGIADGVRVQNLTATRHTLAGVLISGVHDASGNVPGDGYSSEEPEEELLQRYEVRNVTATNNGLYGIYAFHSQHGAIVDSYASGGADSGFYLGQCVDCDAVVTGNVAERNAVGFENANASGGVLITGNRFAGNRVGLTLTSDYQEAFVPQRDNVVVGNVISDNVQPDSPAQAEGGFGVGIGIAGGQQNVIERNLIGGNTTAGTLIGSAEDVPSLDNRFVANQFSRNRVDIADISTERAPSSGTCLDGNGSASVLPDAIAAAVCPAGTPAISGAALTDVPPAPPGVPFLDVTLPGPQPQLEGDLSAVPEPLPGTPERPAIDGLPVPDPGLLADRSALSPG